MLLLAVLAISLPTDAMRLKDARPEGAERNVTSHPMHRHDFPSLEAYMHGIKKRSAWAKFYDALDESFAAMYGYEAGTHRDEEGDQDVTRPIVLASMTRCWRPSPKNVHVYSDPEVIEEMLHSLKDELTHLHSEAGESRSDFRPVHMASPLKMFGPLMGSLPHHHIISFTNEGGRSRCLDFDYGADRGHDPAGCRFFRASFEPIQKLTRCVQGKIEADPYRKMWEVLYRNIKTDAASLFPEMLQVLPETEREQVKATVTADVIRLEQEKWTACQQGFRKQCEEMDPFKRTMELLKRVEYKDWSHLTYAEVHEVLKRAILQTKSIPTNSAIQSLSDSTVLSIIETCFEFPASEFDLGGDTTFKDITGNDKDAWWRDTPGYLYKETLKCLPLVWDAVEVPRAPYQMLWFNTGKRAIENDFKGVHPLCGRLALAPLAIEWRESKTQYSGQFEILGASWESNFDGSSCFDRKHATCKTLAECWIFVMKRHMPDLSEYCAAKLPGPFDISNAVASVKQSGFSCCCDREQSNVSHPDYEKFHRCEIMQTDGCPDGMLDHSSTRDGRCRVTEAGSEFYLSTHSPPAYCRQVPNAFDQLPALRSVHVSAAVAISGARLGEVVDAPCLDGSTGKVRCLYSTPTHGRWSTVQCASIEDGWCPAELSEWYTAPDVRASRIGDKVSPECMPQYRRVPKFAKTTCGSVNGYLQTSCVYDPDPDFDY